MQSWPAQRAPSQVPRRRRWDVAAVLLIGLLSALAVTASGAAKDLERGLQVWRAQLHPRHASGKLVLVEVDARSLAALDRWPWPRALHARAIEALGQAGAATIAFDVDFSARSDQINDAAFARAINRSNVPVVLPTFQQAASDRGAGVVENLPLPAFRAHAMLAAVNIVPDPDGFVRSYPYGVTTAGTSRPSIGALLANAAGSSGHLFAIDGSIDLASIPRISFVDLIRGRVPMDALHGKSVLIGATAIEMGDRYPLPGYGIVPGALIQLQAAETLIAGSSPVERGAVFPLLLVAVCLPFVTWARRGRRAAGFVASALLVATVPFLSESAKLGTFQIMPALVALCSGTALAVAIAVMREARAARLTDHDTGLPNRRAFAAQPLMMETVVVALRLANYSDVVGVLGAARASDLVARTAERLTAASGLTVYRCEENVLGWAMAAGDGDEQIEELDRLAAALHAPFDIGGRPIELTCAFGLATLSTGDEDALAHASMAADHALLHGLQHHRHDADLSRRNDWRLGIAAELDRAIEAGEIWVAYQPKYDVAKGSIGAAEALVRWRHPTRGAIAPDDFIPALEENGRIADLTLHVIRCVLADQQRWRAAGLDLDVAVNISALLPAKHGFVETVAALLASVPGCTSGLTFEVTESATMLDPERAIVALERLASLGVKLSIDDYGTGQSTLSYLKRLPAREIKIDKSFVLALETSRADQAMVRSTIALAHELGFKVVAEGVETRAALDMLASYGCDVAQGWHIGKPMPLESLMEMLCKPERRAA